MKIYFWQNIIGMHLSEFIKELSIDNEVYLIVDDYLTKDRKDQGWAIPDVGGCKHLKLDEFSKDLLLDSSEVNSIHVLSPRGSNGGRFFLKHINSSKVRYCFLMEMPMGDVSFLSMCLKKLYFYFGNIVWWRSCDFVLAMGDMGYDWYRSVGFKKVYPFAYTVSDSISQTKYQSNLVYKFVCVAQAIPRKDPKLILTALSLIDLPWQFTYVGNGPLFEDLQEYAKKLGIFQKTTWIKSSENIATRNIIANSDTLILPSLFDGWGAVVNEAIAEGTRVVVSNKVGAKSLLSMREVGDVFESKNFIMLSSILRIHINMGTVTYSERLSRRSKHSRINGKSISSYFIGIVNGNKPSPPWVDN